MLKYFTKLGQAKKILSSREAIKIRAREIVEKKEKLTDHLEILKINNSMAAYEKYKNIITDLYGYYCKYMKLYMDFSFSQILIPVDKNAIRNIDIKDFVNGLKKNFKNEYETTAMNFNEEDKHSIEKLYIGLIKNVDELVNLLIEIQSNIIISEISPINENIIIENMTNILDYDIIHKNYIYTEDNYLKYLDEFNASKEVFK